MKITLTTATCGFNCWTAKEENCRCSCGRANHGVMKTTDANGNVVSQPQRQRKEGNNFYYLVAVGSWGELLKMVRLLIPVYRGDKKANSYHFDNSPTRKGNPFRIIKATEQQYETWQELYNSDMLLIDQPHMLWRRDDVSQDLFDGVEEISTDEEI